ncbi:hypothetical protein [Kosakonia sacchari]|uniref:hypothetical protein n=1 Tax=Kosakonia sacchari TaxID=1158459 RepID=UPI001585C651|nr:hypothetical protein [Kosakonia sacchari]NUL35098.1 hypothetical protein [Kosakonia sacchari]
MKTEKTHTAVVITTKGRKRKKVHETATSWVVSRREAYDKRTGRRWGGILTNRCLLLETIRPIATGEEAK